MIEFYDVSRIKISDEEYFKGTYKNHISNSRLSLINEAEGGSDQVFVNPAQKSDEMRGFRLGSAIHQLFLESDKYTLSQMDIPSTSIAKIFNTIYALTHREEEPLNFEEALQISIKLHNYYKGDPGEKRLANLLDKGKSYYDYLCNNTNDSELLLTATDKQLVTVVLKLLNDDKEITELLKPDTLFDKESNNEEVFVSKISNGDKIYNAKIKIDNWTLNYATKEVILNDLKTTSYNLDNFLGASGVLKPELGADQFNLTFQFNPGSFQKYHYYRQFAMYKMMLTAYLKEQKIIDDSWTFKQNVIVAQTTYEPRIKLFSVEEYWIDMGKKELQYLFDKMNRLDNLVFLEEDFDFYDL
jgi:hypothetical protein